MPANPTTFDPPGFILRIWEWIKGRSTWFERLFGVVVIVTLSVKWGYDWLIGSASDTAQTFDYWSDKAFVLSALAALLIGVVGREYFVSRKERYANIFDRLEAITAVLRNLTTYLDDVGTDGPVDTDQLQKLVHGELASVMDNIGEMFSMLTGTTCRVALKCIFRDPDNQLYVYAITRDRRSNIVNSKLDKDRLEQRRDLLIENDDFQSVFDEKRPYFIEGNLIKRRNYNNSSFKLYGSPPEYVGLFGRFSPPSKEWPLPYKATMVFPVQQRESENLSYKSMGCIGFLAIDSRFGKVFKDRFDGPLGASLANALFAPLARYVALLDLIGPEGMIHVQST